MRIIAGTLGGRSFDSPRGHRTHPMSDKIRGALFNMLGDLSDLTVLDAFAGSGALSFEAISRGADRTVAIDYDNEAFKAIMSNLETLDLLDHVRVYRKNVSAWAREHKGELYDVVLADPPYNDIWPTLLTKLTMHVKPGGLFVLSYPGGHPVPVYPDFATLSVKTYGDAQLAVYRRSGK